MDHEAGNPRLVDVVGIGDVTLPVKIDLHKTGRDAHGTLKLRNVLYAPSGICNILGYPRSSGWNWQIDKLTDTRTGVVVGLLDQTVLFRLRLSGHSPHETSLERDGVYFIRAIGRRLSASDG